MTSLSIIIPVRDRQELLQQLLKQLLEQQAKLSTQVEIIVVDDGSEVPIVVEPQSLQGRLKLVRFDRSFGAQAARRRGLSLAVGDIIHFHDSDDLVGVNWMRLVVEAFSLDPDLDVLISSRMRQSGLDGPIVHIDPRDAARFCGSPKRLLHYQRFRNAIGPLGGTSFRRCILNGADLIDVPASQDWLLYDAVMARGPKCAVRHDIKYIYRAHSGPRIGSSALRRVKGFVLVARTRFRKRWAVRAATILYCAQAGEAVASVVRVRNRQLWNFAGFRIARSRALALMASRP